MGLPQSAHTVASGLIWMVLKLGSITENRWGQRRIQKQAVSASPGRDTQPQAVPGLPCPEAGTQPRGVTASRGDAWRAQGSPDKELPLSSHSQRPAAYQRFFFTLALLIRKHLEVSVILATDACKGQNPSSWHYSGWRAALHPPVNWDSWMHRE